MASFAAPTWWILGISASLAPGQGPEDRSLTTRWSLQPVFAVAVERLIETTDGDRHLLLIGRQGEVRHWRPGRGAPSGTLTLKDPAHTLLTVSALTPEQPPSLISLSPGGVVAYDLTDGKFGGAGRRLLGRERFTLRTGQPRFCNFATDVNGDRRPDLVIPGTTHCSLYLNRGTGDAGQPQYRLASRLETRVESSSRTGSAALSSRLNASITIPDLHTADVNGDGRADLIAEESGRYGYHLQRADGSYARQADVSLDLSTFRDTTPKASFRFGKTVTADSASMRSRDLTGDGIPDYVILHRRKVWVFHASKAGPQFTDPAKILITTEDLSFATLVHLDDDQRPDLLLIRLQAPSIATLLAGLLMQWDVEIEAIGYRNDTAKAFSRKPAWRSTTTLRAPRILDLLSRMDGIAERFQAVSKKFRHAVEADLDGNGTPDILMQTQDRQQLEFWIDAAGLQPNKGSTERQLRRYLFEDDNRVWDIERILGLMGDQAASRQARLTKGKTRTGTLALRDPTRFRIDFAAAADLDGDGRQEVVLRYREITAPANSVFDVLGLPR